ncbi:MAG: toxin-antitoxin system HicB family antitoxin [Clostridia bacterium]|jgi:hypothetical protein|nr:toxin-antitoxin system HicB family antitoxin [Clostridia bacterium]
MAKKKSFLIRIEPQLYEVLERWAADEFRSVNAQIEYLLRESVRKAGRLSVGSKKQERDDLGEKDK